MESGWAVWLKNVERAIVIVASLAALVPLWQFYREQGERRLDRASNFILAYNACLDYSLSEADRLQQETIQFSGLQGEADYSPPQPIIVEGSVDSLDQSDFERFAPLTETIREALKETIERECDYITTINRPAIPIF